VLIELGLSDPDGLVEIIIGQRPVKDGVAVLFEVRRLQAA
jgi:hypothetical protein